MIEVDSEMMDVEEVTEMKVTIAMVVDEIEAAVVIAVHAVEVDPEETTGMVAEIEEVAAEIAVQGKLSMAKPPQLNDLNLFGV
jgi:hypothetical protein